jgi:hypothetical protein
MTEMGNIGDARLNGHTFDKILYTCFTAFVELAHLAREDEQWDMNKGRLLGRFFLSKVCRPVLSGERGEVKRISKRRGRCLCLFRWDRSHLHRIFSRLFLFFTFHSFGAVVATEIGATTLFFVLVLICPFFSCFMAFLQSDGCEWMPIASLSFLLHTPDGTHTGPMYSIVWEANLRTEEFRILALLIPHRKSTEIGIQNFPPLKKRSHECE